MPTRPDKKAPRKTMGGPAAHTQDARAAGLDGKILRPIRLVFLGAGSFFAPRLVNDVVRIPHNCGGTIALVDIDESRLKVTHELITKLLARLRRSDWTVEAAVDRTKVLPGANYIVNCIEVSGLECVESDNDIPLRYGVDQCIGDTLGPGGLFKALRTIPVWLDVLRDCERLCPGVIVLNYTNPMSMMCLAAARTSPVRVVGLCHSVQNTSQLLARYAGIPYEEMEWNCAGINHLAWFTKLSHRGQDLYPTLKRKFQDEVDAGYAEQAAGLARSDATDNSHGAKADVLYQQTDLIRKDMCLQFGGFITESSGHLSEYLPYYRKSEMGRRLLRLAYDGGSRFYATNWPTWRAAADRERKNMISGKEGMDWARSWEYASWIIEACEKDVPYRIYGNVLNNVDGTSPLIANLPADGCVEVACLIDRNGVQPTRYGALPPQMAAVCRTNMNMIDLGAQAAVERDVEKAIYSLLLDPLTSAVCTPSQIRDMTLDLFKAQKKFLPKFK